MTLTRRKKIVIAVLCLLTALAWVFYPNNKAKARAEKARQLLRQARFKTELSDFDFTLKPDVRARAEILNTAGHAARDIVPNRGFDLFRPVGTNAAIVLCREEPFTTDYSRDAWPLFRGSLSNCNALLDGACVAALSGPIRFEPAKTAEGDLALNHLSEQRWLAAMLATRTLLSLHDHQTGRTSSRESLSRSSRESASGSPQESLSNSGEFSPGEHSLAPAAWTNLLALTRLATAWDTEPVELAYLTRFGCLTLAARMTWEAQKIHALGHNQISALKNEWEHTDLFRGLPDTAELSCAVLLRNCEAERQKPVSPGPSLRQAAGDLFDSPGRAWSEATWSWRESRYRNFGSYEDELAGLTFYRQREIDLRSACKAASWAEIRRIPGITNAPTIQGILSPRAQTFAIQKTATAPSFSPSFSRQRSLIARAAEAEARRRLVLAALALEDYFLGHGCYPASLNDLPTGLHAQDFMDGQPLRYNAIGSGSDFLLYSTGLDCIDDGGQMRTEVGGLDGRRYFRPEEPDLLWPRAAKAEE